MTTCTPTSTTNHACRHGPMQAQDCGDIMQSEHQHCVMEQRWQSSIDFMPIAKTYEIQDRRACPETFGTTNISGNANVIQGDIYFPYGTLKVECRHPQAQCHTQKPYLPLSSLETLGSITRTTSWRNDGWRILPFITLTLRSISKTNSKCTESSWTISVNFFQFATLTFGFACQLSGLTFFRPTLRHIVPDDAPFIVACKRGDIITMRNLVSRGQAAYSNVTKDNLTPLYFALESGIVSAVQEVINNSFDVDATFGNNQTSALAWALYHRNIDATRLILAKDADIQHISLLGWTPVFYLWRDQTELQGSSLGLLQMLQTSDPKGFKQSISGVIDIGELSLLHRVASLGTLDELHWLLGCGVDAQLRAGQLEWTAMFDAAYDGRLDNLGVLEDFSPGSAIHERDLRGWSLLHVAAAEGQTNVVRWLLEKGADPFVKSRASFVDIPEALFGLECTPAEVARAESVEREQDYWSAVRDICGQVKGSEE